MLVLRFVANVLYTCAVSWYNSTPVPVLPRSEFGSARSKGPAPVKLWATPPSDPSGQSVLEMLTALCERVQRAAGGAITP